MRELIEKLVAVLALITYVVQIVPAVEYKSTMERSRARLDYYIERAAGAVDEQSWEENAERSIEQAIKEWETENLAEKETDPEGYEKKQKELRTYLELEKESKYVEWLTGRYAEKAGKEVLKELKAELKAAIRGYSVEGYGADEAEKLQKDIKLKTEEIIERYIEEYESRYGIKNPELAARIKEKGIREEAVRDGKECLEKEEVITEARMLARAEGSRLVARFQSDTKSLRAENSEKAAGVIAGRIAEKAAKESNEKIDELLTKIETNLETGEKEGYSNEGLLMQFQEVFNRGLSAWEEAELEFLTNRAEWEKEAEEAYNTSEKVWTEAYSELQKKRTEWAESIQEKIKDLKNKIEAENYEQEKKVEGLLEKYRALINEEVERKLQAAHSQKTIYNNLRSGLGTVTEGLNAFEKIFEIDGGNGKYDGIYSYWKTEAEGQVEKVDETLINEVKKQIKEKHLEDTKTEAFVSWLEQAEQYNKRIKETIETIKNLTADTNVSEGKYSELELEIYKAKSVEKYWAEELEIAEAVEEYAETKDSTRESREETEKRLKESEESYKEAWKAYDEAIEKLNEYSKKIEEEGAKLQGAYRELAEKKETVEQLKAEYQLLYAQSQGLDEYAVVKQIYTNIKYYEETEKNLKAAEEKYEKYSLIKAIEEEKKKIEKNAADSLIVYERTEAIIDGIIEKIKGGSIEEYESYLDGIDWKGTYETENGLYGTDEYLKEKYREEMNEISRCLNEIKTAEIESSGKTERFKEYVKRIYSAKALSAAEYIKKCEAYKKAGLEDSEPEVNETEKYLEKAEKELEADTKLTDEEKSSIEDLIKKLNEAEKYELKEEKKAFLKEEGARYNEAKVRENNQKETKALLDYINTNEVSYKGSKYDSIIEYCAEISRLAEKCGNAAAKTAAEYIDSYLRQEAFKYQAESENKQVNYKKELNKLAEEIEEKIQNNQENDYEKLIVEYNFLSYAYEEAEADKWITILEEEKYSENKKLEEKEAEYINEFLSKNKNSEKEKTLEEITKAKKKFLTDIAECIDLSEDGLNEESETNYNAIKEAADSYLSKLMICANEYRLLKEEVNTSQLEAKSREIKEAEEAASQKTEYYQSVLEAFHKASEEYEKKVEETNEIYRKTEESRLEKRKVQAVYDWAESIYLKSIGENTDENYVTPKEQASEAEYAYKRAKQSREILEATAESRKTEKAKASEEEKAYKEADRNYYLASVLNSRLEEKLEQEKQKLGEAESKESEARKGVVKKVREARTTAKVSVTKDENGEYHYSLNGGENNAEEQKSFWEKEEILEHEVIADEVITAGELELEKWLSRMLDNEDYFLNILISAVAKKEDIDTFFTSLNKSSNFGELDSYYKEAVIGLFVSNDYVYKGEDVAASILMMNSDSVYSKVVNDLVSNYVTKLASIYVVYKLNQYALFSNFSKYYTLAAYQCWTGSVHNYETSMQKLRTTFQEYTKRREEREAAAKEYYKVLYGQEEKPAEKLSGREIRKDLKAAFSEYRDFTEEEIDAVLGKLGEEESFTDRIEAMNIALERFYADYKNKKEALEESLAEKAKLQAEAAEEYNREVQAELQIKDEDKKSLREYALKASDSKLTVSERKEWAKKYDELYAKIEKVTDSSKLKNLAQKAYGKNTFNMSSDYQVLAEYYQKYLDSDYSYSRLNMNKKKEAFWSNGNAKTDTDMLSRYYDMYENLILSRASHEYAEYEISIQTEFALYKKENSDILNGVYDVARIAADEWNKAEGKLNAQYNQWRKSFIERYEEAGKEWQEKYEEFLSDKQQWITRMYVSAASETGYTGIRADEEARKSLTKTRERMVRNISRESFDAGEYVRDLIGSSLIGKLNSHLDTIAGRTDGVHLAAEVQKKNSMSGAENLLNAMKVLEETSAMMKKTACKKAAQDAGILLDQKIEEAYSGIETTNKNVEENIDSMLYGAGYLKSGNLYARKVLAHSYLVQDVYKIQAVAGYNWYNTARPELRISSAMFEGLETDGIITLMNTATMELEDWQARIFGVHDGVRDIKGEIERHIGSKQDYGSEIGRIMFQYDRNEKEKDAGKAEFEAAPWDKQITESPCSWVEVPSLRSVVTTATAVASAVVTTLATSALSVVSFGALAAPMAVLCGAAVTLSAEAMFAVADVAGGYRDWDEVGKDLAISAATSVISAAGGAAGAAVQGIGGIGGVFLKTGVSVATSATNTVATNAIQYAGDWDGFASSMASFDTWSGVITSGAGSLISNSLNLATIGDNGVKVTGFSSMNISDMQNLNSVVGGLASSGLEYGLTGKTTLNVLNIADIGINSLVNRAIGNTAAPQVKASCGLLELHLDDSQGASFALGTGGTDLSIGTVASAARGLDALKTNFEINHFTNKNELQNAAIALREQYGFGGKAEKNQLKSILNGKTELKTGSGDGNAQTVRENGKRVVYLNNYSNDMTREEQIKLGITLGHEAYRDGVKGDELTQKIETRNAVAGHTDMMTRMLGDSMYAGTLSSIIAGDTNLQLDLIARSLGDDVFNDYVDNCYDSSADYWKLMSDGSLAYDGNGNLYDENGNLILKTDKGIQGGLAQILGITSEEARQMIDNSGFDSVPGSWNVDSNFGKSITFDSATNAGLSYGDLYDNGQHKITDYLTGQNGTLKELNPKTIYDNMVSNKTMDVKKEYQGILGGLKTALKGESKYISYEEYRDNNYITGGMPREGIDYKVGDPLNVKDGNYNLITTMFRAEGNLGTHYGIDLSAVENTKVYAMLFNDNTKASFTEELNGAGGNYTSLNLNLTYNFKGQMFNDSIIQRYMHLNGSSVPNNSLVNATTVFALSGNTGSMTTAPHLHIDISSSKQSPWLNYMSKTNGYATYYNSNNQRTYYAPEMFLKNYKWKNENAKFYNR